MAQGYFGAWIRRERQLDDKELIQFIRAYQRRALLVGKARAVAEIEEARKEELRPMQAAYAVALEPAADSPLSRPDMAVRGVAILEGEPQSFYERAKLQVLKVLVRELGA